LKAHKSQMASFDPIVDLAITHSEVPPDEAYTLGCKIQPKVNGPAGYLWFKRGRSFGALTAIRVDHGSPDTSDFLYGNIETQLNPNGDMKAFLAFQYGEGSPIIDIVLHEGESAVPAGYIKHFKDVYRVSSQSAVLSGKRTAYLAYKTVDSAKNVSDVP
jgi:hypothetical protein